MFQGSKIKISLNYRCCPFLPEALENVTTDCFSKDIITLLMSARICMHLIVSANLCACMTQNEHVVKLHGPAMLPDKAKFVVCSIISLGLSFWMKHLVIGHLQKPAKFSAFHWSTSRIQAFIGQLLGTSRVVHLPKRTVIVLFTISDA